MQGTENKVAGKRGLHGNIGDFAVPDFTDENNVGSLPQHGAENFGERQADAFAHLTLVDTAEVIFDGVFGGDDFTIRRIEFGQRAVKCGGFSRTGRTGNQKNSVGPGNDALDTPSE